MRKESSHANCTAIRCWFTFQFPGNAGAAPPKIAGLLPAHACTTNHDDHASASEPLVSFLFDNPVLAELCSSEREQLFEAADVLLEIAVAFMRGTFKS